MIRLSNPVTGHQISTDDESAEFWAGAGYRETSTKPEKKATAKKSSSSSKKK